MTLGVERGPCPGPAASRGLPVLEQPEFTLSPHLAAKLTPEVTAYIPGSVPQHLLTDQLWARCCEAVWTSCAATLPGSRVDAKTQMSVTCAFLAFTDKVVGSVDLATVLTEGLVQRFLINSEGGTPSERSAGPQPYTPAELENLAAAAFSRPTLAGALAHDLGVGVVVPAAVGTPPPAPDTVRAVTGALRVDDRWLAFVSQGGFSRAEWAAARSAAEAADVLKRVPW